MFPEAINATFPQTLVQQRRVSGRCLIDWLESCHHLPAILPGHVGQGIAQQVDNAVLALGDFEAGPWGKKYPAIAPTWRRQWEQVLPFFSFPPEIRRILYTINAIESLNSTLRTAIRSRGHFPADEAATKLLYLVLRGVSKNRKNAQRE